MKTEAWWTCSDCGMAIAKVGKKHPFVWDEHRKACGPLAGGYIKQWTQRELAKQRKMNR